MNNGKNIIIVSGPSGVGKGTICKEVVKRLDDVVINISMTTRTKSDSEVDGKDYWFVTKEEFDRRIQQGLFLEYAEVFGNMYGTPKDKVEEKIDAGKTVILEIDVQGAKKVKIIYPDAKMIFVLPPDQGELSKRIDGRGRDSEDTIEERLNGASNEIAAAWQYYEHMVINDNLEQAVNEVIKIIDSDSGDV